MAEEGWTQNEIAKLTIKEYVKDFPKLDALILGCTHYPLFKEIIEKQMPNTEIINTGEKLANYMKNKIIEKEKTSTNNAQKQQSKELNENNQDEIYLTDTECNFINVSYKLLNEKIELKKANI